MTSAMGLLGYGSWTVAALVFGAFLLAGIVKGVIGMGLPTLAMGLLGVAMPPAQAASMLVVPSLVTNVWQLAAGPAFTRLIRRLWQMMLFIAVGTWMTAGVLTGPNARLAAVSLGAVLVIYACFGLAAPRMHMPARHERWASPLVGFGTGLLTGATGIFTLPAVPYLQALGLDNDELIQALGLTFTVATMALGLGLSAGGALTVNVATASLVAVVPAVGGMYAGQWVRSRLSAERFRRVFFVGLLVLGAYLGIHNATA
jgi:uncharacterized protein